MLRLRDLVGRPGRARAARSAAACLAAAAALAAAPRLGAQGAGSPDQRASPADSVIASALAGVITDAAGRALAGAVVTTAGLPAYELSATNGSFALRGLPPGPREFVIQRVGFTPAVFELDVPPQATVNVRVTMQPAVVQLGTVVVDGEPRSLGLFRSGFYDRAARHVQGYFYPPDEILRRRLTTLGTLLGEVPGLQLDRRGNDVVAYGRDVGARACPLNVWVDGMLAAHGPTALDVLAPAQLVRAVEVYPQASGVPSRYVRQGNTCGALLVWTAGVAKDRF